MVQTSLGKKPKTKNQTKTKNPIPKTRARGMDQVVEHLPHKCKDLSSNPSTATHTQKNQFQDLRRKEDPGISIFTR
jgi:hypothetical protein